MGFSRDFNGFQWILMGFFMGFGMESIGIQWILMGATISSKVLEATEYVLGLFEHVECAC